MALTCQASLAGAADFAPRFSVWDVALGASVATLPEQDLVDIACGTNGGPPSRPLARFEDFAACRAEDSGLHEVYFRYDDELEFIAKALELEVQSELYAGTSIYAHPIIASVLIDDQGVVQGLRLMTDSRAQLYDRRRSVALRQHLLTRFRSEWACQDLEAAEGETPIANQFVKLRCTTATDDGIRIALDARYLRKKGQTLLNRQSGEINRSYFESLTRLEMVRAPYEPRFLD